MKKTEKLKEINEKHFKDRPNAVKFCIECDLNKKMYCDKCGNTQMNRVKDLRGEK